MTHKMLTPREFAELAKVPYPTVMRWLKKGLMKGAKRETLGPLVLWQIPRSALKMQRPTRGRPQKSR